MDGLEATEINFQDVIASSYSSRLDSDFFKKDAIAFSSLAEKWDTLSSICPNIKSGTTPSIRDENLKEGIALLKTNDIRNNIISTLSKDQFFYIDEETNKKMKSSSIKSKDILINIVGATTDVIGRVSFVPNNFIKANITQAMARLRIENMDYLPEYLFAFLLTPYAQRQTNRIARQTGQFNMNLIEVGTFRVWKPSLTFQRHIAQAIDKVNDIQTASQALYKDSEQSVAKLLSVSTDIIKQNISIVSNVSSYQKSGRLDAEYYQPKYEEYLTKLGNFKTTFIPNEFDKFKNSSTNYANDVSNVGVIKTKQLLNEGINYEGVESYFDYETCIKNKSTFLKMNDVVFASMGVGSLGKVSLFHCCENEHYITDSTLRIFRKKSTSCIYPEVLTLYLQSTLGQELIYRYVVGSTGIINIYDNDIDRIPIPIFDEDFQIEISKNVQKSFSLRRQAKRLLEHIKQAVEIAIEQNEETALEWLKNKGAEI